MVDLLHQTPGHVSTTIASVLGHRLGHAGDITPEILDTEVVLQDLFSRQTILALQTRPVFRDVDLRPAVSIAQPLHQLSEARGVGSEPRTLRLGADAVPVLVFEETLQVAAEVVWVSRSIEVFDVVGAVVVHAVEVVGAGDEFAFLLGEHGKTVT